MDFRRLLIKILFSEATIILLIKKHTQGLVAFLEGQDVKHNSNVSTESMARLINEGILGLLW